MTDVVTYRIMIQLLGLCCQDRKSQACVIESHRAWSNGVIRSSMLAMNMMLAKASREP